MNRDMPTKIISYDNLATFKSQYDAQVDRLLGELPKVVPLTEAEYEALDPKDPNTTYIIYEEEEQ